MSGLKRFTDQMRHDSATWFPTVWERGPEAVLRHHAWGLGGETGEVLDVLKKADICGLVPTCGLHADGKHDHEAIASELADVFTYLLMLAADCGVDLEAAYAAKRAQNVERWGETNPPAPIGTATPEEAS